MSEKAIEAAAKALWDMANPDMTWEDAKADPAQAAFVQWDMECARHAIAAYERAMWGDAARDVLAERQRQIDVEGWTPEHDDEHADGEMALAAACYACGFPPLRVTSDGTEDIWPWPDYWWKPKDKRRNLIRAGALILAEIERLERASVRPLPTVPEGEE